MKYSIIATNLDLISTDFYFRLVFRSVHKISACLHLSEQLYCLNSVKFCSNLSSVRSEKAAVAHLIF